MLKIANYSRWSRALLCLIVLNLGLVQCAPTPQAQPTAIPVAQASPVPTELAPSPTVVPSPTPLPEPTALPQPPEGRGAAVPWIEYEAEAQADADASNLRGELIGDAQGLSREFGEIAAEASGRRAVQLNAEGDYIRFTTTAEANALVLRFAIPDAPNGGGITTTLSLYVNDQPWPVRGAPWDFASLPSGKLELTSHYAWVYGGRSQTANTPNLGDAHKFYDEVRALVEPIPAGSTIELRKDTGDDADYYVIDLLDLEQVAAPLARPEQSLSLVDDCGATPNDATDDGQAIQTCIDQAMAEGKSVWIPAGNFISAAPLPNDKGFALADVSIQGAGMWYSVIQGPWARFNCTGNNCRYFDFSLLGATTTRIDTNPENGFNGGAGTGSLMERVWVEHTKVGWWVGDGEQNVTDGLIIRQSRFRNLFADGINFCNGTSNSLVEHSHFRNTGDDALASWSPSFDGPINIANTFRFNTIQIPWRANCIALYGGQNHTVEDNLCADTIMYPGLLIAQEFQSHPFGGTITIQRNSLLRAGGRMWPEGRHSEEHGALKVDAREYPIDATLLIRDIQIISPTYSGILIRGPFALSAAQFEDIEIIAPGTYGILMYANARGGASFDHVTVTNPGSEGSDNNAATLFTVTRGANNSGW